jgi:Uma2 family endonuclease
MTEAVYQEDLPREEEVEEVQCPPSDLFSEEPPLETDFHREQVDLLIRLLKGWWRDREDVYISGNLTIYYNQQQLKSRDFRGPDFFVVLGTEKKERKSWVVWAEGGKYPNLIVEILSEKTAKVDKGLKKQLYQDTFRTPEYFWFDPITLELQGFHLVNGTYQAISPTENHLLWSEQLALYLGVSDSKLRFFTPEEQLIPSAEERAEAAERALSQEKAKAERLAARLRELGIDPNDP